MDNRPVIANQDFESLKRDMIEYFKSNDKFKDYDFAGSGLNTLMDILAYNTHYNSLAANFLVNEMFLDSAVLRNNVVSIAKMLNYQPRSASAAGATLTLPITRSNTNIKYAIVRAGTVFIAGVGNTQLNFYTTRDYTVQFDSDTVLTKNVDIKVYEGTLITQRFTQTVDATDFTAFELANANIDTNTLIVNVNGVKYTKITPEAEGITNTTGDSNIYFVEETRALNHRLVFGNGVIGKALKNGDTITVDYLITNGEAGNGVNVFSKPNSSDINITYGTPIIKSAASGGSSPETIREIKDTAPHWYQSQYRAVTENDYSAILKKKFSDIQSLSVYGGEKVNQPGKVFLAIKPKSADKLSDSVKNSIINDVLKNSNVVTIKPVIIDPFIVDIVVKSIVTYDSTRLASNAELLKTKIITMLDRFNTQYIGQFLQTYRNSNMSTEIQSIDPSIVGSNTRIDLRVPVTSTNGVLSTYSWSYRNRLFHPQAGYKNTTGGILSTNLFNIVGQTVYSGIDEDGNGKLRLYNWVDNQKIYINNDAGTIDYTTGTVTLNETIKPNTGTIYFTVVPDSFDVIAENNTILRIATNASLIEVIDQNDTATLRSVNLSRSQ